MSRIYFECIAQGADWDDDAHASTCPKPWISEMHGVPRKGDLVVIPGRDEGREVKVVWWKPDGTVHIRLGAVMSS